MDAIRFDNLTRSLQRHTPRRAALGVLGGGLAALLTRASLHDTTAKKGKNKKKKPKLNEFGCVNVGGNCRGKDSVCCSGICKGKKPKKGEKDTSKCMAHNVLDCSAGANACLPGLDVFCGTNGNGLCAQTTGQASFCATSVKCRACKKDADCESEFGPGAACGVCPDACPLVPEGTLCLGPAAP